jgi:hypothetical protein
MFNKRTCPIRKKGDRAGQKERLKYAYDINGKRRKNLKRELADQFTSIFANASQLVSGVLSVIGGLVSLGVISAPIGAVISAFGTGADVIG